MKEFNDMMAFPDDGTFKFSRFGADCVEAREVERGGVPEGAQIPCGSATSHLRVGLMNGVAFATLRLLPPLSPRSPQRFTKKYIRSLRRTLGPESRASPMTLLPEDDKGLVKPKSRLGHLSKQVRVSGDEDAGEV